MQVSDIALKELARSTSTEIAGWLAEYKPKVGTGRTYWWENLITRSLRMLYQAKNESDREGFATVAYIMIDAAIAEGAVRPVDGQVRIANMFGFYLKNGGRENDFLSVDTVVAKCLDLIAATTNAAVDDPGGWQSLSIAEIWSLREAKNLILSCRSLEAKVKDPVLSRRLMVWIAVQDRLP